MPPIFSDLAFLVARATAPMFSGAVSVSFEELVVKPMWLFFTLLGTLITGQSAIIEMINKYDGHNHTLRFDPRIEVVSSIKIMDLVFKELNLNHDDCAERFACEIGKITAEFRTKIQFEATELWNNSTQLDKNLFFDKKDKVFIRSLLNPKSCEKKNYKCELLQELDKMINRLKYHMVTYIRSFSNSRD